MSFIVLKIHASWGWERSETPRVYLDTPDIGPDTPGVVSGHSGRESGYSGFGSAKLPVFWFNLCFLHSSMVDYFVIKNHVTNPIMVECRMTSPLNPLDLAQAIAAMLTGRDEQTALLQEIVE